MNDIIDIVDPGWNHMFTLGIFGLGAVLLFGALVALIINQTIRGRSRQRLAGDWANGLGIAGGISLAASLLIFGIWGTFDYSGRVTEAKLDALEDLGFSNVQILENRDGEDYKFIGSRDGDYFEGALVEDGDLRWQVVELTAAG